MSDIYSPEDESLLETVLEAFEEDGRLDLDYLDIDVADQSVNISGRVSSEEELEIIAEVMKDARIQDYTNNAWVDETLANEQGEEGFAPEGGMRFEDEGDLDDEFSEDESDDDDDY